MPETFNFSAAFKRKIASLDRNLGHLGVSRSLECTTQPEAKFLASKWRWERFTFRLVVDKRKNEDLACFSLDPRVQIVPYASSCYISAGGKIVSLYVKIYAHVVSRTSRIDRTKLEKIKSKEVSFSWQIWRCVTVVKTWRMSLGRYNTDRVLFSRSIKFYGKDRTIRWNMWRIRMCEDR